MRTPAITALAACGLAACAALGGDDGGAAHLPDRGITPWTRVEPNAAPFVLAPAPASGARWGEPSALVSDGAVHLYFEELPPAPAPPRVLWAISPDGVTFDAPVPVLENARAPSAALGPDGRVWLAFVTADGQELGLAVSAGAGSFEVLAPSLPAPPAGGGLESPSLIVTDDARLLLYYTVRDATAGRSVARVSGRETGPFTADGVVFAPGTDCTATDGEAAPCWDGGGVGGPDVHLARTPAGRTVFRMFYRGTASTSVVAKGDLGFAASWDGLGFSRFPFNPVLDASFDELAPSAVLLGDTYLLYWVEVRSATLHGIAVGVHVADAPTDRW